jgi:hypothetical protein
MKEQARAAFRDAALRLLQATQLDGENVTVRRQDIALLLAAVAHARREKK